MEQTYEQYRDWLAAQSKEAQMEHIAEVFGRAKVTNREQREAAMLDVIKLNAIIQELNDEAMMYASTAFMLADVSERLSKSDEKVAKTEPEKEAVYEWAMTTSFEPCWGQIPIEFKKNLITGLGALVETTGQMFSLEAGIAPRPAFITTGSAMWLVIHFFPAESGDFRGHVLMSLDPAVLDLPEEEKIEGFAYFEHELLKQVAAFCLVYSK